MILKNIILRRFIVWIDGCAAKFRSILFSHFYRAIVLASFLSDFRTRLITETDEIGGTVKNVAFRKIKTSKCTTNTSAEFCRAANKHFLQLSHCFRKPITYWKSKTILIICHPFLTPSQREKCPYYPAFGLRVQMRENEDRITSNTDTFLVVPINWLTDKKTWWESSTNFFNFLFSIVKQRRSSIFT